jgi:hypothetical protein
MKIRELWMERSKNDGDIVVWRAQEVQRISDPKEATRELFKYLTKFLVKTEGKITFSGWMLDKIYVGTYRKHLIQSFGFEKPKIEDDTEEEELVAVDDDGVPTTSSFPVVWIPEIHQYVLPSTGEIYSSYHRSRTFTKILAIIKDEKKPITR